MTSPRITREIVVRTIDGVELHSRSTRGPHAHKTPIVCANGIGVSTFFWTYLESRFAAERPVIVWDYRGHGKSGRPHDLSGLTMRQNAKDLFAVMDAHDVERAVLTGHSMGVQVILEAYKVAPSRIAALVPMLGTYGRPMDTAFDSPIAVPVLFILAHKLALRFPRRLGSFQKLLKRPVLAKLAAKFARLANLVDPKLMPQHALDAYIDHFGDFDPEIFFRMAEKMATHSAEDVLAKIDVPVLVVAAENDTFTPLWLSEEMADRLPLARLLVVTGGSHAALVEQPELVNERVAQFLEEMLPEPSHEEPVAAAPAEPRRTASGRHKTH
jgi:pimeloyl-ACP methyl ester carboxylesterase